MYKLIAAIKIILNKIFFPHTCDNEHFIKYLRANGAIIGKNTRFIDPKKCSVDPGRLDYIQIGENCCFSVASIIAHDYSWYILRDSYNDILPDPGGRIVIGNNCFIGYKSCILKGTTIGDNVIIGAYSIVKGNIPSNTVWCGIPARQISTLDLYYKKKMDNRINDAIYRRDHIINRYDRNPTISEMGYFAFLFLERNNYNYETYIKKLEFNGIKNDDKIKMLFFNSAPLFKSFDDFLNHNI